MELKKNLLIVLDRKCGVNLITKKSNNIAYESKLKHKSLFSNASVISVRHFFCFSLIGIIGFVTKYPHRIPGALRIIAFLADTCPDFIQHIPPRERVHVKWVHSVTMVIITRNVVLMGNQILNLEVHDKV